MTEQQFSLIWLSLFVTGLVWMIYLSAAYRPTRNKSKRRKAFVLQRDEGVAGKYIRNHKPRITIHSIVNNLFMVSVKVPQGAIGLLNEFSDVSFWQGIINWDMMRTKSDKVIIRAGQQVWIDTQFIRNYSEAKDVGVRRGIYWFFDGRASPGKQAALLVSLIKEDRPELGVWIDWEHSYGGEWEGLKNVVAMMQEVERLLPGIDIGMYTGFFFFFENSNPIYNAGQYLYLAKKKLWLAFYALLSVVRIPSLWPHMTYWQKGTPPVGHEWGVESAEIDMNEDFSGDVLPPSPPIEVIPMVTTQYKFTYSPETRERTSPDANSTTNLTGKAYKPGDIVNVDEIIPVAPADKWFKLTGGNYAAYIYNGTTRAALVPATVPTPTDSVRVSVDMGITTYINGKQYFAHVEVANVTMEQVQG